MLLRLLSTPDRRLQGMENNQPDDNDDSFVTLFTRLVDNAEGFVRAELRLYRANLFNRLAEARSGIFLALAALLLAQSAVIALLVGLVVILRRPLGATGATLTVVGGAIAIAALLGWLALGRIRKATEIKDVRQK